jgi:hypothetical protein
MLEYSYPDFDGSQPCASIGVDLFYYEYGQGHSFREAKIDEQALRKVCASCSFLTRCATYAIQHEEFGFWGGMSYKEREEYRKKNNIILERIYWSKF